MKKSLLLVFLVLMLVLTFMVVGCDKTDDSTNNDGSSDVCESHDFVIELSVVPATCSNDGIRVLQCSKCEATQEEIIPKLGHTYEEKYSFNENEHWIATSCGCYDIQKDLGKHNFGEWIEVQPATCEVMGYKERVCAQCGYIESQETALADHTYSTELSYDEMGHWYQATCMHDVKKSYETHEFNAWETYKPTTCYEDGIERRYCDCGYFEENIVYTCGHKFSEELTFDDKGHWYYAVCEHDKEMMEYSDHQFDEWQTRVPATCTTDGEQYRTCYCGYEEVDVLEATGHSYEQVYTYDATGHWLESNCGHTGEISAYAEHQFGDWLTRVPATCTTEGEQYRVCYCEYEETYTIGATGHSYSKDYTYDETAHWFEAICEHSGEISGYSLHNYGEWNTIIPAGCLTEGQMNRYCDCGHVQYDVIPAKGHNFEEGNCTGCDESYTYGLEYESINDQEDRLIGLGSNSNLRVIVVPKVNENDKKVTSIGSTAFNSARINELTLPASIVEVQAEAFKDATIGLVMVEEAEDAQLYVADGSLYFRNNSNIILIKITDYSDLNKFDGITISAYAMQGLYDKNVRIYNSTIEAHAIERALYTNILMDNCLVDSSALNQSEYVKIYHKGVEIGAREGCLENVSNLTNAYYSETVPETAGLFWRYEGDEIVEFYGANYSDGLQFEINEARTAYSVVGYAGSDEVIVVPATYLYKDVNAVGAYAFTFLDYRVSEVTLPETIKIIGEGAFDGSAVKVALPAGVEQIGAMAFRNTATIELENNKLPETLVSVGEFAFNTLEGIVVVPQSVVTMGVNVFGAGATVLCKASSKPVGWNESWYIENYYCFDVKAYGILNGMIWAETSSGVTIVNVTSQLTEINVPEKINSIAVNAINYGAFGICFEATSITVPFIGTSEKQGSEASMHNIFGFSDEDDLSSWFRALEKITITNETILGDKAFNLIPAKEIDLTECNIEEITGTAFLGSLIETFVLPNAVKKIGDHAFYNQQTISELVINAESQLQSIGNYAFSQCPNLMLPALPSTVKEIGNYAFYGIKNTNYTSYTINDDIEKIGLGAFGGIEIASLTIPFTGHSIDSDITHLSYIFGDNEPTTDRVSSLPNTLTSVIVTKDTLIKDYAFAGSEIASVTYTQAITEIGNYAFVLNNTLNTLNIVDNIERIGDNAFSGCASMSSFTFSKVKHIGSYAFANCLGVTSLVIPETVEYMGQGMLEEMRMNLKHLTVPFVGETADSKNGTLAYWMPYSGMTIELESVVITNATRIANGAFKEINSLKSITLNDKIEYIGSQAFYNCVALTNVKLPAQLFEIGESAFENCVQYQFNKLPDTLNRIGKYAFKNTAVQGVLELPASLTSMNFSFAGRYGQITKINSRNYRQIQTYEMFDDGITNDQMPEIVYGYENSIYTNDNGDEFYYSVNNDGTVTITKYVGSYDVVIPENINGKVVRDIGVTFRYDSYNSIVVPSGVTRLYSRSLDFNSYLETITLSDGSLKFIGANAFTSNSSITHYVIPESVEVIENFAFQGSKTNLIIYLKHSEIPDTFGEYWNSKDESGDYSVKYTVYCYGDPNDGSLPSGTYWYYDEVGQIKVYSR